MNKNGKLNRQTKSSPLTDDERIDIVAKRVLEEHRKAFEKLAQ